MVSFEGNVPVNKLFAQFREFDHIGWDSTREEVKTEIDLSSLLESFEAWDLAFEVVVVAFEFRQGSQLAECGGQSAGEVVICNVPAQLSVDDGNAQS